MPFRRKICLLWVCLHFLSIIAFACRDLISQWPNVLAKASVLAGHRDPGHYGILGKDSSQFGTLRRLFESYGNWTGIAAGYSYFAPSVPPSYKLVLEIHYPDSRIEYDVPHVFDTAAGYRLSILIDSLAQFRHSTLREAPLRLLVYETWRRHPAATMIRAVVGEVKLPSPAEFRAGHRMSYEVLYSYDFEFRAEPARR